MEDVDYAGFVVGDNRPLSSLRVIDLKSELEKRGLSKSGSKKDLLERLKRQLQLEKLQESAQRNADRVPNLSLQDDAIGSQNEVVKAYLAAQQKTYELQKEARRQIELSADEVGVSDTDASSSQDEGLIPSKSVIQRRSNQGIRELKQSEIISSEVEEAEDLTKGSNKHHITSRSQAPIIPKNLPEPVLDTFDQQAFGQIKDTSELENLSKVETPDITSVTSIEEAENLTRKPPEVLEQPEVQTKLDIDQNEQPSDELSSGDKENAETVGNRLVDITESEMAVAIESISGISTPSYSLETVEVPVMMEISNVENTNVTPEERKPLTEEPPVREVPVTVAHEVLQVNDTPESESIAIDMVKENKGTIETRSKKLEKIEIKENPVDNLKKKVKTEITGDQPMDLSFDESHDTQLKEKKMEGKLSPKNKNLNGSPIKTEAPAVDIKHSSDTENDSQCSDKRSRSRSLSSDSRSSSASFHSESGSFSSPHRKKRIRNTDSEASSSSEDEAEVKRRSKIDVMPPKTVLKTENNKEPALTTKRRKWSNTATESSSPVERRKINRSTISVVESKPKQAKIESEETEDTNDKKDLVLDLHATDETMEVSDAEKELTENKISSIKKIEDATSAMESTTTQESTDKVKKITSRKISLSGSTPKEEDSKPQRKRKWGSITKVVPVSSPVISTDSLKGLIPDLTPALSAVSKMDDIVVKPPSAKEITTNNVPNKIEIKMNKDDEESGLPRDVSPPRKPVSSILYIRNLVRPFTLNQLKEVLNKTGNMVDDGFWIDKIKSKCYVTYETEDQALETRLALHGTRWPTSNPKTLFVDFSTIEELEFHKGGCKPLPPVPPLKIEPVKEHRPKESSRKISESSATSDRPRRVSTGDKDEKKHHDRDRDRSSGRSRNTESLTRPPTHPVIREWDRDKLVQDDNNRRYRDRERERSRRSRENDKPRSKERKDRKDKKVDIKKKQEEETPGKLLDDLFRKTKAMPCIYWLPLTEQQIVLRDEQRKQRMVEREKRRQRIEQEERERMETERKLRLKEREMRMARDRNAGRRSMSRSPIRRR